MLLFVPLSMCRTPLSQEILDTTIKHSPGAIREAVEPRPVKTSAAAAVATAGALALSSQSSVDAAARQQHSDMAAEGEPSDDLDAPRDPEAEDDSDGDQVAIEPGAAAAAATAAAAEELAAAESHSLTQGAMKLVYLLAIQVRRVDEVVGQGLGLLRADKIYDTAAATAVLTFDGGFGVLVYISMIHIVVGTRAPRGDFTVAPALPLGEGG